jgi:hypothetical protein
MNQIHIALNDTVDKYWQAKSKLIADSMDFVVFDYSVPFEITGNFNIHHSYMAVACVPESNGLWLHRIYFEFPMDTGRNYLDQCPKVVVDSIFIKSRYAASLFGTSWLENENSVGVSYGMSYTRFEKGAIKLHMNISNLSQPKRIFLFSLFRNSKLQCKSEVRSIRRFLRQLNRTYGSASE